MRASPEIGGAGRAVLPVEGRGLVFRRNGRALIDGVDLTIEAGPLTVLMGPNGAGKSLLLRVLAGLLAPDAGTVSWAGRAPGRNRALGLGFVFQKPVLLRRSALANVAYALKVAGVGRGERTNRAAEALAQAGLAHLASSAARVLSGGEQQRIAIARALATEPQVLLLDEPTASLDPAATAAIEAQVQQAARAGTKVVFVTHDIGQARRLAGEVVFMDRGRIAERAPSDWFFRAPESPAAAAFIEGRLIA